MNPNLFASETPEGPNNFRRPAFQAIETSRPFVGFLVRSGQQVPTFAEHRETYAEAFKLAGVRIREHGEKFASISEEYEFLGPRLLKTLRKNK